MSNTVTFPTGGVIWTMLALLLSRSMVPTALAFVPTVIHVLCRTLLQAVQIGRMNTSFLQPLR